MRLPLHPLLAPLRFYSAQKMAQVVDKSKSDVIQSIFRQINTPQPHAPASIAKGRGPAITVRGQIQSLRLLHLRAGGRAIRSLAGQKRSEEFEMMLDNEDDLDDIMTPAGKKEISAMLALKKEIIDNLAACIKEKTGCSRNEAKREARHQLENNIKDLLNHARWDTVKTDFSYADNQFFSTHIPAAQMKSGAENVFAAGYNDKGICSKSSDETTHAVNLWSSTFSVAQGDTRRTLFKGIRHGVLSPYDLMAHSEERREGALARAKEVVTAALYLQPDKMAQALAGGQVELALTSTSLLTPVDIGPLTEKSQLNDQLAAWAPISAKPLVLNIRNSHGEVVPVNIKVDVAAFNFGVNELALGLLKLGHGMSDKMNQGALHKLLGNNLTPDAAPGGWVGQYLATAPKNAERVTLLAKQLKTIIANKSHHNDGGEPYKAALRIGLLSHEIGIVPCWNCKSGKDRTGMLDVEMKRAAAAAHMGLAGDAIGRLNKEGQRLMQTVLLNSGNQEIQKYNTGAEGNKSLKNSKLVNAIIGGLTLRERIGNNEIADRGKGLSDYV
ncbi:inositol phosphate phosphatase SopB [Sodalis sp. dw_96]|uniref:inositol phosphate phosphatase SopB n=1 Tax=Sodalis sp. dw_96 TaxID=2719794 RepID=UPI001BD6C2D5|nr:inositol phosphate phosphatase SopB [Sodalis sp. dw_96]